MNPQDAKSVRNIINGCKEILLCVLKLSNGGRLKYIPNRMNVRFASASMYLIKASLGLPVVVYA